MIRTAINGASLMAWVGLWALGGWWLVRGCFHLRRNEEALVGISIGLILETLAANLLGRFLPLPAAFWAAAVLVFLAGLAVGLRSGWKSLYALKSNPAQWIALGVFFLLFTAIARGLAIFDDYAHLPTTSLMAAGFLPPRFALDPSIPYDYHYFLMLFAAQLMRVTSMDSWRTLDMARGLSFALTFLLAWAWTQRVTNSRIGGLLGGLMFAFGTGTRWLLLLLPPSLLAKVSGSVNMIGSGLQSGPDFVTALTGYWAMEGGGPLPFPFAFANGLQTPGVIGLLGVNGTSSLLLTLILLLTFNRWRGWSAAVLTALVWSAASLLSEAGILLGLAGWGLVTAVYMLKNSTIRLPRNLLIWWAVLLGSTILGLLQGGALQGIARGLIGEFLTGQSAASYQTVGFRLVWHPEIVSAHLGVLSLLNPYQLLVALAEMGPGLLVLPFLAIWGWKAVCNQRWFEAALVASGLASLVMLFVEFSGSTGVRNTARLYDFVGLCMVFAVPVFWRWASHRDDWAKILAISLSGLMMVGGIALFGVELPAIQKPVYSYFVGDLDVLANRDYWNQLPADALVFDPTAYRAPTVFGRPTNAAYTWYSYKPEWDALVKTPNPNDLLKAGFSFAYIDRRYWDSLGVEMQKELQDSCIQVMKEYTDWKQDFRRLLDLRGCN